MCIDHRAIASLYTTIFGCHYSGLFRYLTSSFVFRFDSIYTKALETDIHIYNGDGDVPTDSRQLRLTTWQGVPFDLRYRFLFGKPRRH